MDFEFCAIELWMKEVLKGCSDLGWPDQDF
jgi:hypothetical protein